VARYGPPKLISWSSKFECQRSIAQSCTFASTNQTGCHHKTWQKHVTSSCWIQETCGNITIPSVLLLRKSFGEHSETDAKTDIGQFVAIWQLESIGRMMILDVSKIDKNYVDLSALFVCLSPIWFSWANNIRERLKGFLPSLPKSLDHKLSSCGETLCIRATIFGPAIRNQMSAICSHVFLQFFWLCNSIFRLCNCIRRNGSKLQATNNHDSSTRPAEVHTHLHCHVFSCLLMILVISHTSLKLSPEISRVMSMKGQVGQAPPNSFNSVSLPAMKSWFKIILLHYSIYSHPNFW